MAELEGGGTSYFEYMAVDVMEQHLRCLADLLQRGKPMGAGLSDKSVGSIIWYCLFSYQKVRKLREKVSETETIPRCIEQAIDP